MLQRLLFTAIIFQCLNAAEYEYDNDTAPEDDPQTSEKPSSEYFDDPVTNIKGIELNIQALTLRNINCESFPTYALNCTVQAALMYNSSKKAPPMPSKMGDWCGAIKYLTECAQDWNIDCHEVTESHFKEESIKGHMHVIHNICEEENFLASYDEVPDCIESISDEWEECYSTFKTNIDVQKNSTKEWTHYETHFQMCCARAHFRRCTLQLFFQSPTKCLHAQALTLQKFSVIVSEGDVFQDCDYNVMYTNCPGGDPRPSGAELTEFLEPGKRVSSAASLRKFYISYLIFLFIFYYSFV